MRGSEGGREREREERQSGRYKRKREGKRMEKIRDKRGENGREI